MSEQKVNFSQSNCEFIFKNVLRGQPENNIYTEHKKLPFKESETIKKYEVEKGTIFDDNYKKGQDDSAKLNLRYGNKYTNGHLKSSYSFQTPNKNINNGKILENKASKSFILSDSDTKSSSNALSQSMILSENQSRRIKDTYLCNPMQILSKEEFQNLKNEQSKAYEAKTKRVTKLFSSQLIKNTVQSNKKESEPIQPKITNNDFSVFKEVGREIKTPGKKNFKHVVDNGRVFYY